jgi:formyltetrahydrofolate synthetase
MTMLEVILTVLLIGVCILYATSKYSKNKDLNSIILDVKEDLKESADNISELVLKAKDIIFDENIQKTIKEFIMIVEEKNRIAKAKGETYLSGDEKKKAVISRLTEWVSNLTGSVDNAIDFVESNQTKIESIIDDYIAFSNKMEGKNTLSAAEKLIQEQLNK